jgi:AraC-like DNA-binding protein
VRTLAVDEQEIVYGYMLGARDLREALQRMVKFAAMLQERLGGFRIELDVDQEGLARLALYSGIAANIEQRFAGYFCHQHNKLIESLAWMIDRPIALYRVDVPFPPTAQAETYLQRLRCPVDHGAACFAFYFDPALLQAPIVRAAKELDAYLHMLPAVLSASVVAEDFSTRVERLMEKQCLEIGGIPTVAELAALLNMSVTTLRRRLNEQGRSYSEIKHDCRLRLGKELLAKPYRKVFDVAQRLGYRDANAFRRVFKQATGQTPAGYHKNCQRAELVGS